MADAEQPRTIRFGAFEVDQHTGELRKKGTRIKLQQQPFQILLALLERKGDIVTREELRRQLWPEDTFVDFDHSLNAAVKRLREALGESADNPVFIETLARRGYRFTVPIEPGTIAPERDTLLAFLQLLLLRQFLIQSGHHGTQADGELRGKSRGRRGHFS